MERGPKTSFSCARCGIAFLGSPEDAAQHFLGKRHKSSYWSKSVTAADRDKEDANSVFVPSKSLRWHLLAEGFHRQFLYP